MLPPRRTGRLKLAVAQVVLAAMINTLRGPAHENHYAQHSIGSFRGWARPWLAGLIVLLVQPVASYAQDSTGLGTCPDGRISKITVDNGPVFVTDAGDYKAVRWVMDVANFLHVRTSASFIRKELLFTEGDCFDAFLLSESRRLLDRYGFLSLVIIDAVDDDVSGDKVVHVSTRDEWSTQLDVGVTYDGGLKVEKLQLTEKNFLGHGVRARISHRERREIRRQSLSLSTPRFFGRSDASIGGGTNRGGTFFNASVRSRFVGETNRSSTSQRFETSTNFFSYSTGKAKDFSHVLVPMSRELFELSAGIRVGDPGRSWIIGGSLERDVRRRDGVPEFVQDESFGQSQPGLADLPTSVLRQIGDRAATRIALHFGLRRYRYEERVGLDAVRDVQTVSLGYFAGFSVGRSLRVLLPEGSTDAADTYARVHASMGIPVGSSLIHGGTTTEVAHSEGEWRDLLTEVELIVYARAQWLPNQTLFFRVSSGGGWRTTMPFQLTLGGRDGVRSLRDDQFPGGRRVLVVLEDRIKLGWPRWKAADIGLTVFGDVGRIWKGDAPFGVDSGWQASVGVGLRLGMPTGTRNITRPEIVFPLGRSGPPIFRITVEFNRLRGGFGPPKLSRSRRFRRGPESF